MNNLNLALQFATKCHQGQRRISGEEYIRHPIRVMTRLKAIEMPEDVLITALLHDTIEDCGLSIKEITESFGEYVGKMVGYLTKSEKGTVQERLEAYYRDLAFISVAHPEILLIKICDQLDNIDSFSVFKLEKRERKLREISEISLPLYRKVLSQKLSPEMHSAFINFLSELEEAVADGFYDLKEAKIKALQTA